MLSSVFKQTVNLNNDEGEETCHIPSELSTRRCAPWPTANGRARRSSMKEGNGDRCQIDSLAR